LAVFGIDVLRVAFAAGDLGHAETRRGVGAPGQGVGIEPPSVSDIADRFKNFGGVEVNGLLIKMDHVMALFGTAPGTTRYYEVRGIAAKLRPIPKDLEKPAGRVTRMKIKAIGMGLAN
jgi:hypothetical protein